ncbi:hypothetical protein COOONC_03861 [Cooperia oncophora]
MAPAFTDLAARDDSAITKGPGDHQRRERNEQGAFLVTEIEEKFGCFDWLRLRDLPITFISDMVHCIQLYGELITNSQQEPKRHDDVTKVSPHQSTAEIRLRELYKGEAVDVSDVSQESCEEELFTCSKKERNDARSVLLRDQPEDSKDSSVADYLQPPQSHSSRSDSIPSSSRDSIEEKPQIGPNTDSKFENEMFKEIPITDLLQSENSTENVCACQSGNGALNNGDVELEYYYDPEFDQDNEERSERVDDVDFDCNEDLSDGSAISGQDEYRPRKCPTKQNVRKKWNLSASAFSGRQELTGEIRLNNNFTPISAMFGASSRELLSHSHTGSGNDEVRSVLKAVQISKRFTTCSSLYLRNEREPFVDRLITVGEKWLFPNSKGHLKTFECQPVLLRVWWSADGVLFHAFHRATEAKSAEVFCHQIEYVHKELSKNLPKGQDTGVILLHDNTRSYVTRDSILQLAKFGFEVLSYPAQSPDLLPSSFYFFKHLTDFLAPRKLADRTDLECAVFTFLESRPPEFYRDAFSELVVRWQKCIECKGNHFS